MKDCHLAIASPKCGSCPWVVSPSQDASAASCRTGSSSALGGELETERRYTDFAELHESVCAKNFSLLGLTPTELRGYFPEKSFFKNSQTIQQERKEARTTALVLLYSRLADGFGSVDSCLCTALLRFVLMVRAENWQAFQRYLDALVKQSEQPEVNALLEGFLRNV